MDESCVEVTLSANTTPTNNPMKEEPVNDDKENDGAGSSPGRSSPEANCPICLGRPENKSFTDSCLHQFCFTCLLQWSKVKAECPLCKQGFKSIIHNVRSIQDYEQYYLSTDSTERRLLGLIARYEPTQSREPFRYRTTVSSYLDYFVRLEEAISHHVIPSVSTHSGATHWQRRRQRGTSDFRRNIYQQGLWVQRLTDVTGRVRECSPEFYRTNPAQVHRLVPWLNRELNVLLYENSPHIQHVLSRILELITQVSIRSPNFSAAVAPYFGRHTEHFVHEFHSFATSPFDLIGYDRHANYVNHSALAHEIPDPLSDGDDSDVQILDPVTVTSPFDSIQLDSDSDECVVVDSVAAHAPSPEVITLESDADDDIVQVNIKISPETSRPGPSRRPLKRNWLTVNNIKVPTKTTSNDNVNVSINIAHGSRSHSPSPLSDKSSSSDTSSSSWTPEKKEKKKSTKVKRKREESKKKKSHNKKSVQRKIKRKEITSTSTSVSGRSPSPVVAPRRRRPSVILKSSSEDDNSNDLHIVTDEYSSSSSDESEYKPRLRSVVVKSNIRAEPRALSPAYSLSPSRSSSHWLDSNSESQGYSFTSHVYPHCYPVFDPDIPGCSSTSSRFDQYKPSYNNRRRSYSSSSSERPISKKCKHFKKRSKKEKL